MRLLFVIPYTPTPIRTRPYNFLRVLAVRGHEITLATLWETAEDREALTQLAEFGIHILAEPLRKGRRLANVAQALLTGSPLQSRYSWHPGLAAQLGAGYDLAHIEHVRGGAFVDYLRRTRPTLPVIWDSVDCISHLFAQASRQSESFFSRRITALELDRTRQYESRMLAQVDRALVSSFVDQEALSRQRMPAVGSKPAAQVDVVTNGVDLDYFSPIGAPRDFETIVFTGKLSYHANVSAVVGLIRDVMPAVWSAHPNVTVQLVGKDPVARIHDLAAAHPLVELHADVPDLRPFLRSAGLAVAPMTYGAGIQNKVIEAMACATPVLTTPQGGSALADGNFLRVAGIETMATEMAAMLAKPDDLIQLGRRGRIYVEQHHDWDRMVARLEDIYFEVISSVS